MLDKLGNKGLVMKSVYDKNQDGIGSLIEYVKRT